jgi:O-antigen ligase
MTFKNIYQVFLGLSIFLFCFAPKSIGLTTVLLILFTIFLIIKKELKFHFEKINFLLFVIYLCYLIGVFFSENKDQAFKYLEYKLVLLIFPLLFSFRFKEKLNFKPISIGLILGLIVTSILGLINSFKIYQTTHDFNNSFGSTSFSYIHHPSYFSSFLLIGICFAYYGFKQNWRFFSLINFSLFTLFSLVMQFFCFSFAGLLFLLLLIVFISVRYIYLKTKAIYFYSALFLLPFFFFLVYNSNIHVKIEIDSVFSSLKTYISNPKKILTKKETEITGNDSRLIMWTVTAEEIAKHPFGVGTGDVDYYLNKRLQSYNLKEFATRNYNPHNQFLQITLEIGVFALIIFLLFFYFTMQFAIKNKNWILLILIINLFFNCLFESMLQRQSGIVFYVFFALFLIASTKQVYLNDSKK